MVSSVSRPGRTSSQDSHPCHMSNTSDLVPNCRLRDVETDCPRPRNSSCQLLPLPILLIVLCVHPVPRRKLMIWIDFRPFKQF